MSKTSWIALLLLAGFGMASAATPPEKPRRDGSRDFDFQIGTWKTHVRRLKNPLTGSTTWIEMHGITRVTPVWGGRGVLVELEAESPTGTFQGLSLRLYNPETGKWSLNFANAADGTLTTPTIGGFKNGRGEFFNREVIDGKPILVRFVISDITPTSVRFEQSFSDDGKTWEVNWIATDTRIDSAPTSPAAATPRS